MRFSRILILFFAAVVMTACSDDSSFRVNGDIVDKPTMNLRFTYVSEGSLHSGVTAVREGKFEFYGVSKQSTIVEMMDYDWRPLGRVFIKNGEAVNLKIDRSNSFAIEASGNEVSKQWADFLRENSDSLKSSIAGANAVIGKFISENPSNILSTILLVTSYDAATDPVGADSLLELIDPIARPSSITGGFIYAQERVVRAELSDSISESVDFYSTSKERDTILLADSPYNLIAFTSKAEGRADSVLPMLRRAEAYKTLKVVELSADGDTVEWRRGAKADSATWTQGWFGGGIGSPVVYKFGIRRVPYFIVADSAGAVIYRGSSTKEVEKTLKKHSID